LVDLLVNGLYKSVILLQTLIDHKNLLIVIDTTNWF